MSVGLSCPQTSSPGLPAVSWGASGQRGGVAFRRRPRMLVGNTRAGRNVIDNVACLDFDSRGKPMQSAVECARMRLA